MKKILPSILLVFILVGCSSTQHTYTINDWKNDCGMNTLQAIVNNSQKLSTDLADEDRAAVLEDSSINVGPWLSCAAKVPDNQARGDLQAFVSDLDQAHQNIILAVNESDNNYFDLAKNFIDSATSKLTDFQNRLNALGVK